MADLSSSVTHLLHRTEQAARLLLDRHLVDDDLTFTQYITLVAAFELGNDCSQTQIFAATGVDRSTTANVTKSLVRLGLITRRRSHIDARRYEINVTPDGKRVLEKSAPAFDRTGVDLLAIIPKERRSEFIANIEKIIAAFATSDGVEVRKEARALRRRHPIKRKYRRQRALAGETRREAKSKDATDPWSS